MYNFSKRYFSFLSQFGSNKVAVLKSSQSFEKFQPPFYFLLLISYVKESIFIFIDY